MLFYKYIKKKFEKNLKKSYKLIIYYKIIINFFLKFKLYYIYKYNILRLITISWKNVFIKFIKILLSNNN